MSFNPLPHAEGDQFLAFLRIQAMQFQSTPSRRGRLCVIHMTAIRTRFNPLPHAEGDTGRLFIFGRGDVSIHSLTQRETFVMHQIIPLRMFQSTPSRRGRLECIDIRTVDSDVSIHSLTQRETFSISDRF